MSRPTAQWLLQMNEFYITVVTPGGSQPSSADLLAQFPSRETTPLHEHLTDKKICSVETEEWGLTFDGSSTH